MPKEYTVLSAQLKCPMGSAPSNLIVLPQHRVQLGGKLKANIGDCAPVTNVPPFGLCKSLVNPAVASATAAACGTLTPMPCTPACSIWIGGKTDLLIDGMPALMKGDKALCPLGAAMIEVADSGQSGGGSKAPEPPRLKELKLLTATKIVKGVAKQENIQGVTKKEPIKKEKTESELIQQAIDSQKKASDLAEKYGYDKKPKKTVASNGETNTLSGWKKQEQDSDFTNVSPEDVMDKAQEIGHQLRNSGGADQGIPGQYYASHAEKKLAILSDEPIGVSMPMCDECQQYFSKLAVEDNRTIYVADPEQVRVFNPDGSVTTHPNDGGSK